MSEMKQVFCPKDGKRHWANQTADQRDPKYRCTKCGEFHEVVK